MGSKRFYFPAWPVICRELSLAARSRVTHRSRILVGGAALLTAAIAVMVLSEAGSPAGAGRAYFGTLSVLAYGYCVLAGFGLTLNAIGEERRQGTLPLLFLTGLRCHEVVLGKFFIRSFRCVDGLLAIVPVFAVALVLGGVLPVECWRTALALACTLFVSLTIGMMLSATRLEVTPAAFMGLTLTLTMGCLLPLLGGLLSDSYSMPVAGAVVSSLSPWQALSLAGPDSTGRFPSDYWPALEGAFAGGCIFLFIAMLQTARSWGDLPNEAKKVRRRQEWMQWDFRGRTRDPAYRRRLMERHPVCWLSNRAGRPSAGYWIHLAITYGLMTIFWLSLWRGRDSPLTYWWIAVLLFDFGIRLKLNLAAGARFLEDKRSGALEIILSTPMGFRSYVRGHLLALWRQFGGPLLAALTINLILLAVISWWHSAGGPAWKTMGRWWSWGEILTVSTAYLLASWVNFAALALVGCWFGFRADRSGAASLGLLRVMARPWAPFLAVLIWLMSSGREMGGIEVFCGLMALSIVSDAGYIVAAVRGLKREYRKLRGVEMPTGAIGRAENNLRGSPEKAFSPAKLPWRRSWLTSPWSLTIAALVVMCLALTCYRIYLRYQNEKALAALREAGAPSSFAEWNRRRPPVSAEDNALTVLNTVAGKARSGQAIFKSEDYEIFDEATDYLYGNSVTPPARRGWEFVEEYLEKNQSVLDAWSEAAEKPVLHFGPATGQFQAGAAFRTFRAAKSTAAVAILYDLHRGRPDDAFNVLVHTMSLADAVDRGSGGDFHWMAQMEVNQIVLRLQDVLRHRCFSDAQLRHFQERLKQFESHCAARNQRVVDYVCIEALEHLRESAADRRDRSTFRSSRRKTPLANQFNGFLFAAHNLLGALDRERAHFMRLALQARNAVSPPRPEALQDAAVLLMDDEAYSVYEPLFRGSLSWAVAQAYKEVSRLRACRLAVAIERYRLHHDGTLPKTLDKLVPDFIQSVPESPHTGHLLEYVPDGVWYEIVADGVEVEWEQRSMHVGGEEFRVGPEEQ